jgi:hypothetical protein
VLTQTLMLVVQVAVAVQVRQVLSAQLLLVVLVV